MCQPLLLLDIDGVISLFGFRPQRPPPGRYVLIDGIIHFLSATAGPLVGELGGPFELAWCSGWEEKADQYLPAALGLPAGLPHLSFDTPHAGTPHLGADTPRAGTPHWKLGAIDAFAGPRRPLAWVDDAHDASCAAWAHARGGPTKLLATLPAVGLTADHVTDLLAWRRTL